MNTKKALAAIAVAATLTLGARTAFAEPAFPWAMTFAETDDKSEREADRYDEGTDAIDDENWSEAIQAFRDVAQMKSSRADGALYWMAYALNRSGRRAEALTAIDGLRKNYPKSKWIDDAEALEIEARQAGGERVSPERIDDEDLKMVAINSLMHTDPEKAYPLLEKIIRGPSAKKIKERALFILAQSPSPRAQALIASIARGNANPNLQKDAVKFIGIHGGDENRAVLAEVYASSTSTDVKKEVLQAFMLSDDKARVLNAAKSEKDAELRETAIHLLGIMDARPELNALYAASTSNKTKEDIIQALFIAGDEQRIAELARGEKDPSLRREAIRKLGLMGGTTANALLALYNAETSIEGKTAVIEALFLQDNARALIDLSKREKNPQLRREALQKLSIMDDDEALKYMLQILEE
jgi:outer membrane protein assembly factor BamD (BamD/ComL family)